MKMRLYRLIWNIDDSWLGTDMYDLIVSTNLEYR